ADPHPLSSPDQVGAALARSARRPAGRAGCAREGGPFRLVVPDERRQARWGLPGEGLDGSPAVALGPGEGNLRLIGYLGRCLACQASRRITRDPASIMAG